MRTIERPVEVSPAILAARSLEDHYLIWSLEHQAWWSPGGYRYEISMARAGRYSRERALQICADATVGKAGSLGVLPDLPVRLIDALAVRDAHLTRFPQDKAAWI